MKYYSVVEIDITDSTWVSAYAKHVTKLVEERGGRYLARTSNAERIEGERKVPLIFLILEWPSRDAAMVFYESEESGRTVRIVSKEQETSSCSCRGGRCESSKDCRRFTNPL